MANNLGSYQNPLQGGWYMTPSGHSQQYWNGQWYDTPQQGGGANSDPFQTDLNKLNNNTNAYFDQQQGFYQKQHDIQQNQYDTQNTLALGSQPQSARDAFLNSIYSPEMKQQGSYQYGYNMNLGHNNNVFGLQSTANQQNRDLALAKLATDEQNQLGQLHLNQGIDNQKTLEDLNSRGMLYGQTPTGGIGYQGAPIQGLSGLAGQQAGLQNQNYALQENQITQPYALNVQGANQDYTQQQNMLNENHNYDLNNLAYTTANDINNQNMNYTTNTAMNNNQLEQYKASLNNQKQQQLYNNEQNAKIQGAMQNGYQLYR